VSYPKKSEAGSAGIKQVAEGGTRVFLHTLSTLPLPNVHSSTGMGWLLGCGLGESRMGSSPPQYPSHSPTIIPYLKRFAYPHYRIQIVAIVTEEKLIFSLRNIVDTDVYL
jgi:hypothetical protein